MKAFWWRHVKTENKIVLGKNVSVYDSRIWFQYGRAFAHNLVFPSGRVDSNIKRTKIRVPSLSKRVSRFTCPFEQIYNRIRLHFVAVLSAT